MSRVALTLRWPSLTILFPVRERWALGGVFAVAMLAAIFETLGVASILPFMTLVLDPTAIDRYPGLAAIGSFFGATSNRETLLLMGIAAVVLVALGNATAAANVLVNERFAARTSARLATELLEGYLVQPYSFHVQRDGPSLLKVVLNDVRVVVGNVIRPFLIAASKAFVTIALLSLLFVQEPSVAMTVGIVLGVTYFVVFRLFRVRQRKLGVELHNYSLARHRIAQEALGGVKDLQILGRERHAISRFEAASRAVARAEASNNLTAALPRYVLEAVVFGGILIFALVLLVGAESAALSVVPVLALYAFAGYRLLPALQQLFSSAVSIRFYHWILKGMVDDLTHIKASCPGAPDAEMPELRFNDAIMFEKVSFTYVGTSTQSLKAIDLVIRPRESVGLVGRTGAGKTTLADMLLGLYEPTVGTLTVDGVNLSGPRLRAWRKRVGYVPQHVFLANATVAENIAFALDASEIDSDAVIRAARLAQADVFINALSNGYETLVGERGVKLSGGQRQRLGIARALYHDPDVLIFDEATSALDGLTEDALMAEIRALSGARTIVLIAHRLRTVEACDRIVMLEQGQICADGRYHDLLQTSEDFRRLLGTAQAVNVQVGA